MRRMPRIEPLRAVVGVSATLTLGLILGCSGADPSAPAAGDDLDAGAPSQPVDGRDAASKGQGDAMPSDASSNLPDAVATPDSGLPAVPGYTLTWHDEFDGTTLDTTKWGFETGAGGWGNGELEYYTDRVENAAVAGGVLRINALQEAYTGPKGSAAYTSARLLTRGKFDQKLGRFEARMKLPAGQGIWPAFWMLGSDIGTSGWPGCGEIDVMENIGRPAEQSIAYATIHGPDQAGHDYNGGAGIGSRATLTTGRFADDFHTFRVDWEPGIIRFFVDGAQTVDATTGKPKDLRKADLPAGWSWVFDDHAFFMILNLAVGGQWPGSPDGTTVFPQTMQVDYVRVYTKP